ncbi:MAG: xanthine dehydrogenase family protein molybdopterin-binding subunit [Pseudolabrys sp.]|nr:xanthine dehydrogenase family protein molybdopterin-binding subunit [Pseudolabrys sp.]
MAQVEIGMPQRRVEGELKVTGQARYAAEYPVEGLLYGFVINATIAKGRIAKIDTTAALAVPGVIEVFTHENRPNLAWFDRSYKDDGDSPGSPLRPLYDDKILYDAQPIALLVAETFEIARYAVGLVDIEYEREDFNTDFVSALPDRFFPKKKRAFYTPFKDRGDAPNAYKDLPVQVSNDYHMVSEHHNPMELNATTVVWEGDGKITVYDKNQGSQNVQKYLASVFGLSKDKVRVLNPFVGGAFGSGLRPEYQVYMATLAATTLKHSVRVTLTRQQMFSHVHRPEAVQTVSLASDETGRMNAMMVEATTSTSRYENFMETVVNWGGTAYACENAKFDYNIAALDIHTPGDMRAPGAATGMNIFEMAMDELAYAANVDPLELRIKNYSEQDAMNNTPYTSKALMSAYKEGAARFGWEKRSQAPRSMKDGTELVGWGMATGMWEAMMAVATVRARIGANGQLEVASATSDIGTGTYTIMTQIAAETLGLPMDRVTAKLGDSDLPLSPIEGGSWTAATVGAAVQLACRALGEKLFKAASKVPGNPFGDAKFDQIEFIDGQARVRGKATGISLQDLLHASGEPWLEAEETAKPSMITNMTKSRHTHSAVFVEVKVDEELGVVRVTRVVNAVAGGRIINPLTARSQILGGVVMGMGMALHEDTLMDHRLGRIMNHSLAEYHVPAHADVFDIDVIFVDEPDPEVSPLGVKGLGEIGIVGVAAAISNAIFHATGKRVRSFPITIDKILSIDTTDAL